MFDLGSIIQTGAAVLRVTFTGSMPLSASPQGANDALNTFNWKVQGAKTITVGIVRTVSADPFSFDLILNSPLTTGNWTLTTGDIQTPFGVSLDVDALTFASNGAQPYFTIPLSAMTSETVLRQALNSALDGPGWKAFVAALGYSDQKNTELAAAAALQKNLATATGVYLEHITTSYGIDRKADVGIGDESLRTLTLGLNANKVNTLGLETVLQAYYGIDATVAHATAGTPQPYNVAGQNLIFEIDGIVVSVSFTAANFQNPSAGSAQEVATVINREFRLLGMAAIATETVDPDTGFTYLRIYSGQNGIKGSMRWQGGSAEYGLQFPTLIGTTADLTTTWSLTNGNLTNGIPFGNVRLSWTGGTSPQLIKVFVGDYVNLYGNSINAVNQGTYAVVGTNLNYIDLQGIPEPINQTSFAQLALGDIFFVRPSIIRLAANNVAFVAQAAPGSSEVVLAATTVAVSRTLNTAWYLNSPAPIALQTSNSDTYPVNYRGGPLQVGLESQVTVQTSTPHGLSIGRFFTLDGVATAHSDVPIAVRTNLTPALTPLIYGKWHAVSTGYIGWDSGQAAFQLLNATASAMTNLGNAGLTGSSGPTMVTLQSGRVLIVSDSSTTIYDPITNTFAAGAAPPNVKKSGYNPNSAAVLSDGRVVVLGFDNVSSLIADIYNPNLNSWANSHVVSTGATSFTSLPGSITTGDNYVVHVPTGGALAYIYSPLEDVWRTVTLTNGSSYIDMVSVRNGSPRGALWLSGQTFITSFDLATQACTTIPYLQTSAANRFMAKAHSGEVFLIPTNGVNIEIFNPKAPLILAGRVVVGAAGSGDSQPAPLLLADNRIIFTDTGVNGALASFNGYSKFNQESGGGLAGTFQATAIPSPTQVTFQTPLFPYRTRITAGVLTPILAETQSLPTGYMLDTAEGVSLSDSQTKTTVIVAGGTGPQVLQVASTTGFPNTPGYILLSFGRDNQSLPLRYIGVASATQLLLDPGVTLAYRYPVATTVDLLTSRGTFVPVNSVPLGVSWLTASAVGRLAAETDLDFAVAAGLNVITTVMYPGDRGLGNEGLPTHGVPKITDAVFVWGSDNVDAELATDRETS